MKTLPHVLIACLLSLAGGVLASNVLLPKARAEPPAAQATKAHEYKVVNANFGGMMSSIDKFKVAQEKALNEFAKDGWRLVSTAPLADTGYILLYLER